MAAGRVLACELDGPLGTVVPRGLLCLGATYVMSEKYRNYPTSLSS